jgi:hypothetical protein
MEKPQHLRMIDQLLAPILVIELADIPLPTLKSFTERISIKGEPIS